MPRSSTCATPPDATWTVNDTMLRHPATVAVFNAFRVDACCGGAATLAEAASTADVSLGDLLHALAMTVATDAELRP